MNIRAYEVLEFARIRERLASLAETDPGKARALALEVSCDKERVSRRLGETSEARRLDDEGEAVALRDLPDVAPFLEALGIEGRSLTAADFVALFVFAGIAKKARGRLSAKEDDLPRLWALTQELPNLQELETELSRVLDTEKGDLRDDASAKLAKLRASLGRLRQKLQKTLDRTLASRDNAKLLQEPIVTTRNGRSVLPVKAECKSQFRGIVHGASASGATLFIEPMATVEVNNEIASVLDRERQEVRRILAALTERVRPSRPELTEAFEIMTELDLAQAKGRLSASHRAAEPRIGEGLALVDARHPLLDEAVPVSFHVSGKRRGLVFTGPNTGGKTVALKAAGLLSLMVQAGLHVPASSQSSFPVFRTLFADIGDDQSIASNLSTFSSHLAKVVAMEHELDLPSLIILDEVGTGTDPSEGGALGTALVEHFLARGALVIASTHHGLLKAYASTTQGIDAASFQFDPKTYAPTYTIVEGAAGRSLAFEMAERLGLPASIVTRARELQSERERQVGELVQRLEAESAELEAQQERLASDRRAATAARTRIEAEEEEERVGRRERLTSFRRELEEELDSTRRELRELVAEARQASKEQNTRLNELEKTISAKLESVASPLISKVEAETLAHEMPGVPRVNDAGLEPGMRVLVASFGMEGEILRLVGDGQAEVNVRDKKLRLPVEKLEPLPNRPPPSPRRTCPEYGLELKKVQNVSSELNLIGCTVEDALDRTDKFLDAAFLSEHREVRLIHGHGTGRLKSALREWLTGHPQVANQKSENRGGVTVVELKD